MFGKGARSHQPQIIHSVTFAPQSQNPVGTYVALPDPKHINLHCLENHTEIGTQFMTIVEPSSRVNQHFHPIQRMRLQPHNFWPQGFSGV